MRILIAPDKFKGSLSAMEVCQAIAKGLEQQSTSYELIFHPIADGGDGSLDVLSNYLSLEKQSLKSFDPVGRLIPTYYFTSGHLAFIELANASGLVLLSEYERDPLKTSTFGTGQLIANAISKGYEHIYLFLGGSATNDAGIGIAAALGCIFYDEQQQALPPVGESLIKIKSINFQTAIDFKNIKITLLCDVRNPLFGPNGAAYVYARQKGADDSSIEYLDRGLMHYSKILHQQSGIDISNMPGSGAAGGVAASMIALFGAQIKSGIEVISSLSGLEEKMRTADWVISGEGKLDAQSLEGKVVDGIASLCKKHKKPLILFVGKNELSEKQIIQLGARQISSILEHAKSLEDAMLNGALYLEKLAAGSAFI